MSEVLFFPYNWDESNINGTTEIQVWGKEEGGSSSFVRIMDFPVTCEMQLPLYVNNKIKKWNAQNIALLLGSYKAKVRERIEYYNKNYVTEQNRRIKKEMPDLQNFTYHESYEFYYHQTYAKPFVTLSFKSREDMYTFIDPLKKKNGLYLTVQGQTSWYTLKVWETVIHSTKKFLTQIGGLFSGWYTFISSPLSSSSSSKGKERIEGDKGGQRLTKDKYNEYCISWKHISFLPDKKTIPPIRVLSFDLETYSDRDGEFPDANVNSDEMYMVSCVSEWSNKPEERDRAILTIGDCPIYLHRKEEEEGKRVVVRGYETELDLIQGFIDYIVEDDPDLITGYNTLKFDWPYSMARSKRFVWPWNNPWSRASRLKERRKEDDPCFCPYPKLVQDCAKCSTAPFKRKDMTSSGRGENVFEGIELKGRMSMVDMCVIVKTDYKNNLKLFNLNYVSNVFLKESKRDVSAREMFGIYRNYMEALSTGEEDKIEKWKSEYGRVGDYCIQDSELVNKLMVKLKTWSWLCTQSAIYGVNPENVYLYGQQKRGISMFYEECRRSNVVMTDRKTIPLQYKGGYVSEPKRGVHRTFCVDYNSLYPNTGRRYNIDFTTMLTRLDTMTKAIEIANKRNVKIPNISECNNCKEVIQRKETVFCLDHEKEFLKALIDSEKEGGEVDHPDYNVALWEEELDVDHTPEGGDEYNEKGRKKKRKKVMVKEIKLNIFMFKKEERVVIGGETYIRKGIFPKLAERLIGKRKAVKREMVKWDKNSIEYIMLDQEQLTLKMATNSLYGFLGRKRGDFLFPEGAMSITYWGRKNIIKTGVHLEERLKDERAHVVYGDSVTGETPCIVRNTKTNKIEVKRIDELGCSNTKTYGIKGKEEGGWLKWREDKESVECDYEVWTDKGWSKIHRVIRHFIPPTKKLIEVSTGIGSVRVTEEHSLLNPKGERIDASKVKGGDPLLHCKLPCIERKKYPINHSVLIRGAKEAAQWYLEMGDDARIEVVLEGKSVEEESLYLIFYPLPAPRKGEYTVRKIKEIPHNGCMVYDLQTENHHFQAGVGRMIVHNTDSVMIELLEMKGATGNLIEDNKLFASRRKEFEDIANEINEMPMHVEHEKDMYGAFFQKKMYAYFKIQTDGTFEMEPKIREKGYFKGKLVEELNAKGLPLARKEDDYYKLDVYDACIRHMLHNASKNEILLIMMEMSLRLMTLQIPVEDLVMISGIRSHYDDETFRLKTFSDHRSAIGKPVVGGEKYELLVCIPKDSKPEEYKGLKVGRKLRGLDEYLENRGTEKSEKIDRFYYILKAKRAEEIYLLPYEDEIVKRVEELKEKKKKRKEEAVFITLVLNMSFYDPKVIECKNKDEVIKYSEKYIPRCKTRLKNLEVLVNKRMAWKYGFFAVETVKPIRQIYDGLLCKQNVMKEIEECHGKVYKYPLHDYFSTYETSKFKVVSPYFYWKGKFYEKNKFMLYKSQLLSI